MQNPLFLLSFIYGNVYTNKHHRFVRFLSHPPLFHCRFLQLSLSLLLFPAQASLSFFHGYFCLATSALLLFTETI